MNDAVLAADAATQKSIVARAEALAPVLRERASDAEALRRAPDETVRDIVEAGLHRICQPKQFGGYELDWTALCESSMALAEGDGSQAWVANVYGEHNCYVSLFPEQAQQDVWGETPDALVSSSYAPSGTAVETDGGFILNGLWGFSSGVHHADWTLLGAMVDRDGVKDDYLSLFLVPAADREIIDDWDTMGMAATGSCSIRLDDVFVPAHRYLDERLVWKGEAPGAALHDSHVYRMPQRGIAQLALASIPVGLAVGAAKDYEQLLSTGSLRGKPLSESPQLHMRLAEASAAAEAGRRMILGTVQQVMAKLRAGEAVNRDDIACAMRDGAYACKLARQSINTLFEVAGGNAARRGNQLQRTFRDIHAGSNHIALGWEFAGGMFGRIRLGLESPI